MKKYILMSMMAVGLVGLYSFRSQLIGMDPSESSTTSTSTTVSPDKQEVPVAGPQVCLVGEKSYCLTWQEAQLSGTLKQMLTDMPEPDDEDPESIIIPVDQGLFGPATIEKLVGSMKKLYAIKFKNPTWNNAQILDELLKQAASLGIDKTHGLLIAQAANYYQVPLLWQAIARWYAKEKVEIASLVKRGVSLMGEPVFSKFANEYYRQYWLINKTLAVEPSDSMLNWLINKMLGVEPFHPMLKHEYEAFGVSIQELLDNGWELTNDLRYKHMDNGLELINDLRYKHINSLDGLMNIPNIAALQKLYLSYNQLQTLPAGIFAGLTALQWLSLSYNQLQTLPAGIFAGLTALQVLGLNDNQLATLPVGIFAGLTGLQELYLSYNQLQTLPAGIFAGLTGLQWLYLSYNQLTTLPAGVFTGLTGLQVLDLSYNQLTTLPAGIFAGLTGLQITTLPAGIFAGLTGLQELYLSYNQLTTINRAEVGLGPAVNVIVT